MKEGDPGYLKSASETDSAMEDSGSDSSSDEGDDEADDNAAEIDGDVKSTLEALSKEASIQPALEWLKTSLKDEMEDRMEDDDENITDVPLVPIAEACTSAMEVPNFVKLLSILSLSAPNDQAQYWRIPTILTATKLSEKCDLIQKIIDQDLDNIKEEWITGRSSKKDLDEGL